MSSVLYTGGQSEDSRIGRQGTEPLDVVTIPNCTYITSIALGWKHGHCVVDHTQFYSWGDGSNYKLATLDKHLLVTPTLVETFPANTRFRSVVAGDKFGAALDEGGKVYCWGSGFGHGPQEIPFTQPATHIASGQSNLICALSNGSVGIKCSKSDPRIIQIPDEEVTMVSSSRDSFIALCASGHVYTWGKTPSSGQPNNVDTPTLLSFPEPINYVFSYNNNSFFTSGAKLYCCGLNNEGSLGVGDEEPYSSVTLVPFDFDDIIIQVACGDKSTLVLTRKGTTYVSGSIPNGYAGVDTCSSTTTFLPCEKMREKNVTQIACGCFTFAFLINGSYPHYINTSFAIDSYPFNLKAPRTVPIGKTFVAINPSNKELEKYGLKLGDHIVKGEEETLLVIGTSKDNNIVVYKNKIGFELIENPTFDKIIDEYKLVKRKYHELIEEKLSEDKKIILDASRKAIFSISGFMKNDILPNNERVIGVRGLNLYSKGENNEFIHVVDVTYGMTIIRNDLKLKTLKLVDDSCKVIELEEDNNILYFNHSNGIGKHIGKYDNYPCIEYASNFGLFSIEKANVETFKKDSKTFAYDSNMEIIELDEIDLENNYKIFDLVETKFGYGTIAGFNGGKVAVWLEKHNTNFGSVKMFDKGEVKSVGRFFNDLFIDDGVNANTECLKEFKLLPGDAIKVGNVLMDVRGVKDGKLIARNGNENVEILDNNYKIAFRRMLVPLSSVSSSGDMISRSCLFCSNFATLNFGKKIVLSGKEYFLVGTDIKNMCVLMSNDDEASIDTLEMMTEEMLT
ncbi:protein kinase [Histomonas meleagridis]|uniref:protein kinase n=1 Tax=Histomonas meleagridis TaxID=135588 RepID=UPI003559BC10|nr:protein kinase [Histomonas meleagridis]KAH0800705.1 protein kinase [Histomonas meleagridis]